MSNNFANYTITLKVKMHYINTKKWAKLLYLHEYKNVRIDNKNSRIQKSTLNVNIQICESYS